MKRVKLDNAAPPVKAFVRRLPLDRGDVELELNGQVVCRITPPGQLSESEKAALLSEGRELVRRARARNGGVPAQVLQREVREAVKIVRRKHP
jgi:hypothetical protein